MMDITIDIAIFIATLLVPIVNMEVSKDDEFREQFMSEIIECFEQQYVVHECPKSGLLVLEII